MTADDLTMRSTSIRLFKKQAVAINNRLGAPLCRTINHSLKPFLHSRLEMS